MSFFGGGTDMESFFREHGGAVLSTTFDKYCYVNVRHLPRFFDYTTELTYSKTERVLHCSERYKNALAYALNVDEINRRCGVEKALKEGKNFNIFSYSYNSPAFEYPYIAASLAKIDKDKFDELYEIQEKLMLNKENGMFSRNNSDIDTWNARTYEIIRFCEKTHLT